MELIKELGSRSTTTKSGKVTSRKWGLFECPVCHVQKEYNLQKGRTNKTCGGKGCRKELANYSPWNGGLKDKDKINNLPYYTTFSSYYQTLLNNNVKMSWKSLKEFRDDMYQTYVVARNTIKRVTLCTFDDNELTSTNCKWVEAKTSTIHEDEEVIDGKYHSALLPAELLIPKEELDALILKEYPDKVTSILYGREGSTISNPSRYYTFTKDEYMHIRKCVRDLQLITSHNYLYLIRMKDTDLVKIGRTSNVKNRLDDLNIGNPYELELLYTVKMFNYGKLEQRTHKFVDDKRVKGEWFKLNDDYIEKTIAFIDNMLANP